MFTADQAARYSILVDSLSPNEAQMVSTFVDAFLTRITQASKTPGKRSYTQKMNSWHGPASIYSNPAIVEKVKGFLRAAGYTIVWDLQTPEASEITTHMITAEW